ncbi:hypothetical protein A8C56_03935 [Niabella ginsenosidivorans]|uniref:Uncharacterized protein n=1 Tax=Niabella ginsenosidivorans TaxID=1176587 RepID=A0A1A9HXY7_9BACT|nr:hypothetical protein A8C56_03935 [Niabella ginsenosidivorans]
MLCLLSETSGRPIVLNDLPAFVYPGIILREQISGITLVGTNSFFKKCYRQQSAGDNLEIANLYHAALRLCDRPGWIYK